MQCPSCDHEAPQSAFGEPLRCPECGAFYEKALVLKLRREQLAAPPPPPPVQALPKPIKKRTAWPFFVIPIAFFVMVGVLNVTPDTATPPAVATAKGSAEATASASPPVRQAQPEIEAPNNADSALERTRLEFKGHKEAGLLYVDFTVTNDGPYPVKDIEIECVHFGKSGTQIDSNERTIYDVVAAHGRKKFNRFNMGFIHSQATKTRCSIVKLKV